MNRLLAIYGVGALVAAGVKAGTKYLDERERRRRLDAATWTTQDVARLYVLKREEIARESAFRGAVARVVDEMSAPEFGVARDAKSGRSAS